MPRPFAVLFLTLALMLPAGPVSSQDAPPDALCCQLSFSSTTGSESKSCFALDPGNEFATALCLVLGSPGIGPCNPETGSCTASAPACCEVEGTRGATTCIQAASCALYNGKAGIGPCDEGRCLATF